METKQDKHRRLRQDAWNNITDSEIFIDSCFAHLYCSIGHVCLVYRIQLESAYAYYLESSFDNYRLAEKY
ncbi:MAG: hypothetical protein WBG48_08740 [Pricia sp.]